MIYLLRLPLFCLLLGAASLPAQSSDPVPPKRPIYLQASAGLSSYRSPLDYGEQTGLPGTSCERTVSNFNSRVGIYGSATVELYLAPWLSVGEEMGLYQNSRTFDYSRQCVNRNDPDGNFTEFGEANITTLNWRSNTFLRAFYGDGQRWRAGGQGGLVINRPVATNFASEGGYSEDIGYFGLLGGLFATYQAGRHEMGIQTQMNWGIGRRYDRTDAGVLFATGRSIGLTYGYRIRG